MGEMSSFWGYDEDIEQQLEQKLFHTTLELEKLKEEAVDELSKNKEHIKQLIRLLKYAVQERDEARNQLYSLLKSAAPPPLPSNPLFLDAAPSVVTDCNSPSDAYNSADSLFHCVASPAGLPGNQTQVQDQDVLFPNNQPDSRVMFPFFDQGSLIIDSIVKGRALPEKGKFREAVEKAGPLLETLMKAVPAPLPQWRNPPQIQHLQIPPVPVAPCHHISAFSQKPAMSVGVGHMALKAFNLQPYGQTSCGTAQAQASPLLNISNLSGAGGCLNNAAVMMSSGMNCSGYDSLAKRPRFI